MQFNSKPVDMNIIPEMLGAIRFTVLHEGIMTSSLLVVTRTVDNHMVLPNVNIINCILIFTFKHNPDRIKHNIMPCLQCLSLSWI